MRGSDEEGVRDVIWLSPGIHERPDQIVGLVLWECAIGGHKGYVGFGKGLSSTDDVAYIAKWGGRIPDDVAARLWPHIDVWYDSRGRA